MKRIVLYFLFLFLLLEITFVHSNPYVYNELNHGVKYNNILNPTDSNNQRRDDKQQIVYSTELQPQIIEEEPIIFDLSAQVAKFIISFIKKYCKNNDEVANLENLLASKGIGSIFRTNGAGKIQPNYGHLENNNKQNNNSPRMRMENTKPKAKANEIGQQHNFDTAPNYKLQSPTTKPIQPDATKQSFRKEISPKQNQIKLTKQYQVPMPQNDYADVDYDYEYEIPHDPNSRYMEAPPQIMHQKLYPIPRIQYVQVTPPPPPPIPQPRDMIYDYEPSYEYASHPDEYGLRSNEYSLPEYDYEFIQEPPKTYYNFMEKEVPEKMPGFWNRILTYITPAQDTPKTTTDKPIQTAAATTDSQRKYYETETEGHQEYPAFTERPMTQSTWPQTSSNYEATTQEKQTPGFFDTLITNLEALGEDPNEQIDRRTGTPSSLESQEPEYTSSTALPSYLQHLATLKPRHNERAFAFKFGPPVERLHRPDLTKPTTINRRISEATSEHPDFTASTTPDEKQTSILDELIAYFDTNPPVSTIQYKDATINRRIPESTTEQPTYSWTTPIYNFIKYFESPSSDQPEQSEHPNTEYSWTQYGPDVTTVLTEAPVRKQTLPSYDSYEVPQQESVITDYQFPHYKNEHTTWPAAHQQRHKKPDSNFEFSVWPAYKKSVKAQPNPKSEGGLRARPDFGSGYGYEVTQNFKPSTSSPQNQYADRIYTLYLNEMNNLEKMKPNYKVALSGPKYDIFVDNIDRMKQILLQWKNGGNFYDGPKIEEVTKQMTKLSGDNLKILGDDSNENGDDGLNARRTFDGPEQIQEYLKDNNNLNDFHTLDPSLQKIILDYIQEKDKPDFDYQLYQYLYNIKDQMEKYKRLFKHLGWVDGALEKLQKSDLTDPSWAIPWYMEMKRITLEGLYTKPNFDIAQDDPAKYFMTILNLPGSKVKAFMQLMLPKLRELSAYPEMKDAKLYLGKQEDIEETPYYELLDEYAVPLKKLLDGPAVGHRRIFAETIEIKTEAEPETTTTEPVVEITTQPPLLVRNIEKHNNVFREFLMNSDD